MKKNWIKKGIVSLLVLAIFMMPFSAGIKINDKGDLAIKIERNEIYAQNTEKLRETKVKLLVKDNTVSLIITTPPNAIPTSDGTKTLQINIIISSLNNDPSKGGKLIPVKHDVILNIEEEKTYTKNYDLGNVGGKYVAHILIKKSNTINSSVYFTEQIKFTKKGVTDIKKGDSTPGSFSCGVFNLGGCVAQLFYLLWQASAWIARLGGYFLDFFIYYSISSSSYANGFVKAGWGAIRDIANIFFIIALLYVAIKTILNLNVTNNKKLIGTIIIVALVINFSLFTTKVVIDGSNILAKVFYNNISSKDVNAPKVKGKLQDSKVGAGGQKSISIGIIDKFNPQNIAMDSYNNGDLGLGFFIFIVLLLMTVTLYTGYIFFSVAIFFVARVVSLWISMIFSPVAFASYTLPFDIPGFGHKEWWKGLLENAFLAPMFIFFLYIIILFTGFLSEIIKYKDDTDTVQRLLTTIIPFVIIMMLLSKAKRLAILYSGAMGKAIMTGAKAIGGLALGAATGGASMMARGTAGRLATNMAEKQSFQRLAAKSKFGASALKMTNKIGSGSFDIRRTSAGKALTRTSGMNLESSKMIGLGSKEGGFTKAREDAVKRKEKFADELLDTSDYGKAQMTKGGMSVRKANAHFQEMRKGGMDYKEAEIHKKNLMGEGVSISDSKKIARHLNESKRDSFADRLDKKEFPMGHTKRINMKNRISANKIRSNVTQMETQQNIAAAMAAWAHTSARTSNPPPTSGAPSPTPKP